MRVAPVAVWLIGCPGGWWWGGDRSHVPLLGDFLGQLGRVPPPEMHPYLALFHVVMDWLQLFWIAFIPVMLYTAVLCLVARARRLGRHRVGQLNPFRDELQENQRT